MNKLTRIVAKQLPDFNGCLPGYIKGQFGVLQVPSGLQRD